MLNICIKNIFTENIKLGSYDANLIKGENGLVHTVDIITSIVDDLYLLGRLAAKHALNDLYASNSFPVSSQMILSVPKSINEIQKRDIYQITKGANSIFKEMNLAISGGHTYSNDSDKSTVGFSLIGRIGPNGMFEPNQKTLGLFGRYLPILSDKHNHELFGSHGIQSLWESTSPYQITNKNI